MPKLVKQGKSLKQELSENKDMINEYTQTRGLINLEQTHLMNKDRAKKEKILIFGGNYPGAYTDMIPMTKLEDNQKRKRNRIYAHTQVARRE